MSHTPDFSVIMPVYNAGGYLDSAIQSVLDQTFENFELILVDDGSSDESPDVCKAAQNRDPRIQFISQQNAGPGAAMNTGIKIARAPWIVVMHADDLMMPNRLKVVHEAIQAETQNVGLITSQVELIGTQGKSLGKATPELPTNPFFLCGTNPNYVVGGLFHPAVVLSRQALAEIGGYSPDCRLNEDVEMFNRLVERGYGIRVIPQILMRYRIHGSAASAAKDRTLLLHWRYLKSTIHNRRAGRPLISWNEYLINRARLPIFVRINEWRKDRAKMHYRRAAGALSSGRHLHLMIQSACSAILQPSFILNRWKSRR
jgi:glycosyltransferase involved in cell wall biosynthesis